jgi:hypothetical protein
LKKRDRLNLIRACSLIGFALACAQGVPAEEEKTFLVRPFFKAGWFEAEIAADEEDLEFVPNPMMDMGVKLGYKKLAASISFGVSRLEDEEEYGTSSGFNAEISYPFRVSQRELSTTAFFHSNEDLSTQAPGSDRYTIDGMDVLDAGIEGVLFLNPRFSMKKIIDELEPRSGNSGSWLVRSSAGVMYLGFIEEAADRVFIPTELSASVGDLADLHLFRNIYSSVSGGYAYDWNFSRSFFFTVLGSLGMTVSRLDLSYSGDGSDGSWTTGPSVSVLLGLTYAGPKFHAGLSSSVSQESAQVGDVLISGSRTSVLLFAGARF